MAVRGPKQNVDRVFAEALQRFSAFYRQVPSATATSPGVAAAVFPRLRKADTPILFRHPTADRWLCVAGTWLYDGRGGQDAACRLVHDWGASTQPIKKLARKLDGMFAILEIDTDQPAIEVVTDRLGTLHVYLARIDDCQVLSTSSLVIASLRQFLWDLESCR